MVNIGGPTQKGSQRTLSEYQCISQNSTIFVAIDNNSASLLGFKQAVGSNSGGFAIGANAGQFGLVCSFFWRNDETKNAI